MTNKTPPPPPPQTTIKLLDADIYKVEQENQNLSEGKFNFNVSPKLSGGAGSKGGGAGNGGQGGAQASGAGPVGAVEYRAIHQPAPEYVDQSARRLPAPAAPQPVPRSHTRMPASRWAAAPMRLQMARHPASATRRSLMPEVAR